MNNDYRTDFTASATAKTPSEPKSRERSNGLDLRGYADQAKVLGKRFDAQVTAHPYAVLGGVAAAAFLAGSVLGSRLGQLAVAMGLGYAASRLAQAPAFREVGEVARRAASAS